MGVCYWINLRIWFGCDSNIFRTSMVDGRYGKEKTGTLCLLNSRWFIYTSVIAVRLVQDGSCRGILPKQALYLIRLRFEHIFVASMEDGRCVKEKIWNSCLLERPVIYVQLLLMEVLYERETTGVFWMIKLCIWFGCDSKYFWNKYGRWKIREGEDRKFMTLEWPLIYIPLLWIEVWCEMVAVGVY